MSQDIPAVPCVVCGEELAPADVRVVWRPAPPAASCPQHPCLQAHFACFSASARRPTCACLAAQAAPRIFPINHGDSLHHLPVFLREGHKGWGDRDRGGDRR
jgi:hypothetical protein